MERYHNTAGDPPSLDMTAHQKASQELAAQVAEFLARGGQIQQFGAKMSDKPDTFVINPHTTPVYNSALAPARKKAASSSEPIVIEDQQLPAPVTEQKPKAARKPKQQSPVDERLAVKIIVEAALGTPPRKIARNLQIPLNRCLAIAEQCRVQFHV